MSGHPLFFLSSCAFYWDSRVNAWVGETSIRRGAGCPRAIASQGTTLSEARQALDGAVDLAIKHWTVEPAWPISPPTKAQNFKWEPEPPEPAKVRPDICGPYKGKGSLRKGCRRHPGNDLGEDGYCDKGRQ